MPNSPVFYNIRPMAGSSITVVVRVRPELRTADEPNVGAEMKSLVLHFSSQVPANLNIKVVTETSSMITWPMSNGCPSSKCAALLTPISGWENCNSRRGRVHERHFFEQHIYTNHWATELYKSLSNNYRNDYCLFMFDQHLWFKRNLIWLI